MQREQIECGLIFLGFLVFENLLKPQTEPTIRKLKQANVKAIMATGDNGLTAISVARECEILNSELSVFLGELKQRSNGTTQVVWKNFDDVKETKEMEDYLM